MNSLSRDASSDRIFDHPQNAFLALAAIIILALLLELPTLNMGRWLDECINLTSAEDLAPMCSSKTVVAVTEQHILGLQMDLSRMTQFWTSNTPRGPQVSALRRLIESHYKIISTQYAGVTEAVSVSIYQLPPQEQL